MGSRFGSWTFGRQADSDGIGYRGSPDLDDKDPIPVRPNRSERKPKKYDKDMSERSFPFSFFCRVSMSTCHGGHSTSNGSLGLSCSWRRHRRCLVQAWIFDGQSMVILLASNSHILIIFPSFHTFSYSFVPFFSILLSSFHIFSYHLMSISFFVVCLQP